MKVIIKMNERFKRPPLIIKIYEALGTLADEDRIEMINSNLIKVYSSTRNKYYNVYMEIKSDGIYAYSNDNGTYFVGYYGYPIIIFLFINNFLKFDKEFAKYFQGIKWKDLNQKHNKAKKGEVPNYDFNAVIEEVNLKLPENVLKYIDGLKSELAKIEIFKMPKEELIKLGVEILPPKGY